MRLNQKVVLVTSSRRGVCSRTAQRLAQAGAKVMICGRNAVQGRATVAEIQDSGGRASFILADIASAADVQAAIDETIATYGRLDILFNCSSPHPQDGAFSAVSEPTWDRIVEVMLKGPFFCCQHALPFLQNSGSGMIINFVEQAEVPQENAVANLCHGGILSITQAIAHQFSTHRVTANLIWFAPQPTAVIPIPTDKVIGAPPSASAAVPFADVADAILYLATSEAPVCGYTLVVNGD